MDYTISWAGPFWQELSHCDDAAETKHYKTTDAIAANNAKWKFG